MPVDNFLKNIEEALSRSIDPKIFEACACEIVRLDYPGTVPVPGGQDSGMDGAIPDFKGVSYPLICTTGEDVIGNLTGSLDSYIKGGGTRDIAILVTSESLTPKRRQNLESRAKEKGFTLVQIYERQAVAERLYRMPRWCKDLLNLTGEPSALSVIPPNPRTNNGGLLIGRDQDLEWLVATPGDCVLSGQPGSGKTYLLRQLTSKQRAFFLMASSGKEAIAAAIREYNPETIILDDAHIYLENLQILQQLRREIEASYRIIAVGWPSAVQKLLNQLMKGEKNHRKLQLLSRDEIVSVIQTTPLVGPKEVIREIVNQAEGKPGLATLLAVLCLSEDPGKFWKGQLLTNSVINAISEVVSKKPTELLAAFSIGGEYGMKMYDIAKYLGQPEVDVRQVVTELAAGGVISEVGERLSVRPPALRYALVRDVFFAGASSLDPKPLYGLVEKHEDLVLSLLGAAHREANIPENELKTLVAATESEEIWSAYGWLGKRETLIVLEQFPEKESHVQESGLQFCPEIIVPRLIAQSVGDKRSLNQHSDHPVRRIGTWIENVWPGTPEATNRKFILLDALIKWAEGGNNPMIIYKFIPKVFSLRFEQNSSDPGAGRTINFQSGILNRNDVTKLGDAWSKFFTFLRVAKDIDWKPIVSAIEQIVYARRNPIEIPKEHMEEIQKLATRMINDIASISIKHPAVIKKLKSASEGLNLSIKWPVDTTFEILYPESDNFCEDEQIKLLHNRVQTLVEPWSKKLPSDAAKELLSIENEAKNAGVDAPRLTPVFCVKISECIEDPLKWAEAFTTFNLPVDLSNAFISRAVRLDQSGWPQFIEERLAGSIESYLIDIVLSHQSPPKDLLALVLERLGPYFKTVEFLCLRNQVPELTLSMLLKHTDPKVAGYAAIGEWNSDPQRGARESIKDIWQMAILNFTDREHWLKEILNSDTPLAYAWILKRFHDGDKIGYEVEKIINSLCSLFTPQQRRTLLDKLPDCFHAQDIFLALVGNDNVLCEEILRSSNFKKYHLELARWRGGGKIWEERILLLSNAGHSTDKIAGHIFPRQTGWTGKESEMWTDWIGKVDPLIKHTNQMIKEIGQKALPYFIERRDLALERERQEAIYGR